MSSYEIELRGTGSSIEDVRKAYAEPLTNLKKLTPEEEAWVTSLGLNAEEFQRQRLAEEYYENFVRNVVSKLVEFVREEFAKAHIDFEVTRVVCEFDRMIFRIFVKRGDDVRSFRISWEDGTDYFEGNDVLAEQHIREAVTVFRQAFLETR